MNPSTLLARVAVDELARCGVRDVVLCPGSRNAPLSLALDTADADGRLRLHVRLDERGAGFLALGLALRSGLPVAVVCTSGTAVANLHPAVLEAAHAGVPLLLLTADRPADLVGTGASQTVVQRGIFGDALRLEAVLSAEGTRPEAWRATVVRAVAAARGTLSGDPGPVQLDVPLREPLLPPPGDDGAFPPGRPAGRPWSEVHTARVALPPLRLDPALPTLVVAGDGAEGRDAPADVPVVAEPSSTLWGSAVRTGPWLLGAALSGAAPELLPRQLVVLGRPTLHRAVQRALADERIRVFAVPPADRPWWNDTRSSVVQVGSLPPSPWGEKAFAARWRQADAAVQRALDASLDVDPVGGMRLARELVRAVPTGGLLVVGPSSPIRDVALAAAPRPDLTVLSNRGVAGIDGVVSTAVGAALAHGADGGGPAVALLGDVTLLHDAGGLLAGPREPRPDLTIVVANDDGGSVFTLLEQGAPEHARSFERVFGTPHGADLAALCAAFRVGHRHLADLAQLREALGRPGLNVVEVPVDRTGRRAGHAALRARVEEAAGVAGEVGVR
ncbi:2-succinyl-5-enolpyruvyl-6-hydroxy-3-cyclohexene-1-carboxylic-acid synthase [Pseudonocardia kujensis]|uniref:2-succinyl-5-enolpyruvyl-6-hydroxy-3- cyclohexene-1-carboxylic-acid synthase n=1 Tax=Pseudonocardia kujensis TaxID=1128675 RepID=UPI001E61ECD9|nr:2-succinyl-5-enolpyruvyl-6-hydroxy-3-cyclohexene-1-carboxylic-acid synthase [Pseudonocardia kujensis]MCE0763781.1 2-succinyl-5-enolpyruvyl-6-hydroxy-3-cyclohexene-1-carboxylic-acid synthase [Pseudonocardia kujensis]